MNVYNAETLLKTLTELEVIPKKKLDEVAEELKEGDKSIYDLLISRDLISDKNLGKILADSFNLPFVSIEDSTVPDLALSVLPEEFIRKQKVFLFNVTDAEGSLAMSYPENTKIAEMVERKLGMPVKIYFATESDILKSIALTKKNLQGDFDNLIKEQVQEVGKHETGETPIIRIVDLLIEYAYGREASDIHIEPEKEVSVVRFRVDGVLTEVLHFPKLIHERVISRIKVLAKLRTDEHLAAQDGKMRLELKDEDLDIRVSTIPITYGEKAVLRLLASKFRQFGLTDLGMAAEDLKKMTNAMNQPFGMILSTGPTGSGKSTTMYSILKILNTRDKNISTIEDPVEYDIEGIAQIQVNEKSNLTFANGLRSILRQDPNIIYVGEIRDKETADISVNSALTGHLVLSTLHTNDAATSIPRLLEMDIEPFLVASTVQLVIGQRLVRKICDKCKVSFEQPLDEVKTQIPQTTISKIFGGKTKKATFYKGKGCTVCHGTGYTGRVGIYELLVMDEDIKKLIMTEANSDDIEATARKNGMQTMMEDGLKKVQAGLTTLEEIMRTTRV